MKVALFSSHRFEQEVFLQANRSASPSLELSFLEASLHQRSAKLASGFDVVCAFANDQLDAAVIRILQQEGVKLIALRSAGFNHVDLYAAQAAGIPVVRVPAYSPHAVAEHAVAMLLALNRKIHRAFNRVREGNFSLDGLVGFDLHGKTVGVVGAGKIGSVFLRIMRGFGCRLLAYDQQPDPQLAQELGVEFVPLEKLFRESDIVSLHVPLRPETRHLIGEKAFAAFREGAILVNTGRGALVDTKALIASLKGGRLGGACLDVYEEEESLFFKDHSGEVLQDDVLARLLTFPNVLVTAHQGFLTREAIRNITETTLQSIRDFAAGKKLLHEVKPPPSPQGEKK